MQGRHLGVGAGVCKVDRIPDAFLTQTLAGIEIPSKKGVDNHCHVTQMPGLVFRQEVVIHAIAVMQRRARIVIDHAELGAETHATHKGVIGLHSFLQIHYPGTAAFIGVEQFLAIMDAGHTHPGSAIVGFHVQGVAYTVTDGSKVKQLRVATQGWL